jgi:hypothetical protein
MEQIVWTPKSHGHSLARELLSWLLRLRNYGLLVIYADEIEGRYCYVMLRARPADALVGASTQQRVLGDFRRFLIGALHWGLQ